MTFSSMFFILGFLPAFFLIYKIFPKQSSRNIILLLFSMLFYLFGGLRFLILLTVEAFVGWAFGLQIEKAAGKKRLQSSLLAVSVLIFLAILGGFKYTGFIFSNLNQTLGTGLTVPSAVLPLGISFYTFKLISYTADVYHERVYAQKSFPVFLTYVICFHTILQGPIVRYADMRRELNNRIMDRRTFSEGMYRFSLGLAKKTILADHMGTLADQMFPASRGIAAVSPASAILGSICFTLQMYLDFSAYSDMAIGLGRAVGFHYKENFNYPYIAASVKDFWRRWHISLSSFFRDYVYIPLGGNRRGFARQTLNLLAVWLLTGLWHGADWNFILWGLYYFVFIFLENLIAHIRKGNAPGNDGTRHAASSIPVRILGHLYTILVFNFGWVIFRFTDFRQLKTALAYFLNWSSGWQDVSILLTVKNNLFILILCVLASTPLFSALSHRAEIRMQEKRVSKNGFYAVRLAFAGICFVLAICALAGATYHPFLYNQF